MRAIWVFYSGISLTQRAPKTNQMGSVGVNLLSFGVRLEKLPRNSGSRSTAQSMCVLMGTPHIQVPQLWVLAHPFPGWPQTGYCFSYSLCPISLFSLVSFLILKIKMIKALHDYTLISKKKSDNKKIYEIKVLHSLLPLPSPVLLPSGSRSHGLGVCPSHSPWVPNPAQSCHTINTCLVMPT